MNCLFTSVEIDALLIAQYYVGLVPEFSCDATPSPSPLPTPPPSGTDVFGITMLYPTLQNSLGWDSQHWNNGINRTLSNDIMSGNDPEDPTFWSEYRGSGTLTIDGNGMLIMAAANRGFISILIPAQGKQIPKCSLKMWK